MEGRSSKRKWGRHCKYLLIVVALYFFLPFPFLSDGGATKIQESTIRAVLTCRSDEKTEVYLIGVLDPETAIDAGDVIVHDPSDELLRCLSDIAVPVLPVSCQDGLNVTAVIDGQVRQGAGISTRSIRRLTLGVSVCYCKYYTGMLASTGYRVWLLWTPVGWRAIWAQPLWTS